MCVLFVKILGVLGSNVDGEYGINIFNILVEVDDIFV